MSNNDGQPHVFAEDNSNKILNVIIAIVLIGLLLFIVDLFRNDAESEPRDNTPAVSNSTLPEIDSSDYTKKEGLYAYNDLKSKGYNVSAEFENEILTEINGNAGEVFEDTDYNNQEERLSVDAWVVGSVIQDGDDVKLIIVLEPKTS